MLLQSLTFYLNTGQDYVHASLDHVRQGTPGQGTYRRPLL